MEDLSDDEIKKRLQVKEENAIAWVIARRGGGVLKMLQEMGCLEEEAKDVVAEAFHKAIVNIDSYQPQKGKFSTWLYRIARNTAFDLLRKRKTNDQLLKNLEEEYRICMFKTCDPNAGQEDGKFKALLDQLDLEERDLLMLKYAAGFQHKEIAERFGITEANCRVKMYRAAKKLKTLAKGESFLNAKRGGENE